LQQLKQCVSQHASLAVGASAADTPINANTPRTNDLYIVISDNQKFGSLFQ
jgi:hypothetical protein